MSDLYLGIDCGGTFIKSAVLDKHGKTIATVRQNLPVISEQAGYAERDLEQMWQVFAEVIKGVTSQVDAEKIKAVGISAQGKGLFPVDKQGKPFKRGILSSDQRALSIVKKWQAENIPQALYPKTRQTLWTGHPVSILKALQEQEPEQYQKIGAVLMSHDYLRYRLTGEIKAEATNISESNIYNFETGTYDPELLKLLGLSDIEDALAPIVGATEIAGYIQPESASLTGLKVGTPVVGGLFDVVSTAICAGLENETVLNVVLGTWSVVTGMTKNIDHNQTLPFVYGIGAESDWYIVHEASPTSSANIEWLNGITGINDYHQINQMVSALPPAQSSVFFYPFLYGSNAGLGMQAGFYGLQAHHQPAHLYQALFEGVMFSLMTHLNRALIRFPDTQTLRVTGGSAQSEVWMQMLADISGKTVETLDIPETGCLGAGIVAMVGAGAYPTVSEAMKQLNPEKTVYQPNPANEALYREKYRKYTLLLSKLQAFNAEQ